MKIETVLKEFMTDKVNENFLINLMKETYHNYDNKHQNPYHLENDLLTHTKMVIEEAEKLDKDNKILIESAALHDIGKILARRENPEKKRVFFTGHEGVSFYLSQTILRQRKYSEPDIIKISTLISLHDISYKQKELFLSLNTMQDFVNTFYFSTDKEDYSNLLKLIYSDIKGRLTTKETQKENNKILSKIEKFLKEDFELPIKTIDKNKPDAYLLIGVQNVGKSTYISREHKTSNVISRDDILMNLCRQHNNKNMSYDECFEFITKAGLHKEVDKLLQQQLSKYKKQDKNIVIDMMNLTKKRRRFFINQLKKRFNIISVVFYTPFDVVFKRNITRGQTERKYMQLEIMIDSMKRFEHPLLNFENIDFKKAYISNL